MTPEELSALIVSALAALVERGAITLPDGVPDEVTVERAKQRDHGDYATNVALQLAKRAGMPPRDVAALLATELGAATGVAKVDVAGPGFLNVTVEAGAQGAVAAQIVAAGAAYGRGDALADVRIDVEFISANPTGPLHLGHTRWAAVGDAIARVLAAAGAEVTREFYINDRGNQMDKFGASIEAAALGDPIPEDGYHGEYIAELAKTIVTVEPGILDLPEGDRLAAFREAGYLLQLKEQQDQVAAFHTHFDVWFSERELHTSGAVQHGLQVLQEKGHLYEEDGALWMRTTEFGDDKDRVLRRGNGELTYFASDTAYYVNKRERGFDICVYLLGADHHGYIGRMKAMAACAGDDPSYNIEIPIGQLVKIMRGGEEVRLSKRAGNIVTLQELVDLIGVDALRYSLVRYPADSPLTLDVEQITKASSDNPVYYVQYAHARLCAILRNAAELGGLDTSGSAGHSTSVEGPGSAGHSTSVGGPGSAGHSTGMEGSAGHSTSVGGPGSAGHSTSVEGSAGHSTRGLVDADTSLLVHDKEGDLLRALADYPRVVASAAQLREPHRVARYLEDTAAVFHRFYDACRVLPQGDEDFGAIHAARLLLVDGTRIVFANGLDLLGVTAPERM